MTIKQIIVILLFINTIALSAQTVRASVDSSEVYVGQPFEFRIIIEGTTSSDVPDLSSINGFQISYKGASTTMVSSFGSGGNSSTKSVTHSWIFTPLRSGLLEIPSIPINVDGDIFRTTKGTMTVKDPEALEGFHLIMDTDKDEYWKGEPVLLNIKWLFSTSVSTPVFNIPFINSDRFSVESQTPPQGSDVYRINIAGLEVLTRQSAEIYEGDQYSTLSFQLKLVPRESGTYNLDPISLAFDRAEKTGGFRTSYKASVIPSNSLSLKIKELPPGAEKSMILTKGILEISTSANPTRVHIGDPLTYTIEIDGALMPEEVILPALINFPLLARDFSIPDRRSPGNVSNGIVTFNQTIRVRNGDISFIPELAIDYFNTETGKIEKAIAPPVSIEVLDTEIVTSADLESTGYARESSIEGDELLSNKEGLLHNFSIKNITKRRGGNKSSLMSSPVYLILLLFPPLFYLCLVLYKQRNNLIKWQRDDFKEIHRLLLNSNDEEILQAIKEYLHKYGDSEGKALTPQEIKGVLLDKGNAPEICDAICELLISLESMFYSKDNVSPIENAADKFYSLSRELK